MHSSQNLNNQRSAVGFNEQNYSVSESGGFKAYRGWGRVGVGVGWGGRSGHQEERESEIKEGRNSAVSGINTDDGNLVTERNKLFREQKPSITS